MLLQFRKYYNFRDKQTEDFKKLNYMWKVKNLTWNKAFIWKPVKHMILST